MPAKVADSLNSIIFNIDYVQKYRKFCRFCGLFTINFKFSVHLVFSRQIMLT